MSLTLNVDYFANFGSSSGGLEQGFSPVFGSWTICRAAVLICSFVLICSVGDKRSSALPHICPFDCPPSFLSFLSVSSSLPLSINDPAVFRRGSICPAVNSSSSFCRGCFLVRSAHFVFTVAMFGKVSF